MTDWRVYQDRPRESAIQCVARAVVEAPGLMTDDYVARCAAHSRIAVKSALHRLKAAGYVTSRRMAGRAGRGKAHVVDWHPTMVLKRLAASGQYPSVPRYVRMVDELEDDGWEPPKWVHPYARRAA